MDQEEERSQGAARELFRTDALIKVQGLSVYYGRTAALDDLDLEIAPGITGLFGPNGSGKSTLLRVIAGLIEPSAGSITLDGIVVSSSAESFRSRVGFVGHEAGLYARLSVRENLELFARLYGVVPSRVGQTLEEFGLGRWADTAVGDLAAGFRRRVAVARALLHEPEVLLLDEPYANLDDDAAGLVSAAVLRWRKAGRTGVIATHGAKRVKSFADGGIILKQGRVALSGRYDHHKASVGVKR